MIAATNWTWEYIDENMTLPRLFAMSAQWKTIPPLVLSVSRLLQMFGGKPRVTGELTPQSEKLYAEIKAAEEFES